MAAARRSRSALAVDANYMFTAEQVVINRGAGAVAARPYALVSRAEASEDPDSWTMHVGPVGVFNGAANYDVGYDDLAEEGDQRFTSRGGWLGFTDKYWLTALIPDQRQRRRGLVPPRHQRQLPGRCRRAHRHRRARPGQPHPDPLLRRRQGSRPARRL